MDKIITMLCILISTTWVYMGIFKYGFWVDRSPGGGFIPILMGILTIIFCVILLLKGKFKKTAQINKRAFYPVVAVLLSLVSMKILGSIITVALLVFIWLRYLEKYTYKHAIMIGIIVAIFVLGVFKLWLQVPLPTGITGI